MKQNPILNNKFTLEEEVLNMVLVYTKDDCMQCDATKMALTDKGIEYKEIDLLSDPRLLNSFKSAGHKSAPIVVTDDDAWAGFQPEKIAALVA